MQTRETAESRRTVTKSALRGRCLDALISGIARAQPRVPLHAATPEVGQGRPEIRRAFGPGIDEAGHMFFTGYRPAPGQVRRHPNRSWSACLALGLTALTVHGQTNALLDQWLAAQTNLHTWTATAIQTRTFQTLSQPLVSTGKVWVALPDRFRWELGQPPRTIAIRQPRTLFLVYPRLKQVEKYSLASDAPGPWRDALALLEASFPRNRAELEAQFRILSVAQSNAIAHLEMQPKSGFARKFVGSVRVAFDTQAYLPVSTELRFSDGSSMRNDFADGVINLPLADDLFEPKIGPEFKVVEPMKGGK